MRAFDAHGCAACHRVAGTRFAGQIGPDLSHLAARATLGAGIRPMTRANLIRFTRAAPDVKPGARMPAYDDMTDADAVAIARWLETLK
nr:cytochrome c [Sphingomonas corticis]